MDDETKNADFDDMLHTIHMLSEHYDNTKTVELTKEEAQVFAALYWMFGETDES